MILVQNFSPILSVIPEVTPLSVLVGLRWLRMLLGLLEEENYFPESSSSSVSAKAGVRVQYTKSEVVLVLKCLVG